MVMIEWADAMYTTEALRMQKFQRFSLFLVQLTDSIRF